MPFHKKTYHINNREEGKAAQRDQSYRNCLVTLLIFFFMCLILILACIPWKTRSYREYKNEYTEYEPQVMLLIKITLENCMKNKKR